ncbi:MAG: ParA/MinD ATPase like protein [Candidatus Tokpelaia hoelldobleri]|uniref:Iron-sulfur cluster carrier protein n=1 Tax=Candidatus Tokpelaia hoelldobleri TaxID=1902579 RepID=A0A1U9JVE4_9HYPH|nr:MAG: ParA/MinD ATPase like protein [Candidatus Tokpelaia hoelldoblerii]
MATVTRTDILDRLRQVKGPGRTSDIVTLGLVSDIFIADNKVFFSITVPAERATALEPMRQAAEKAVLALEGVKTVTATLTAEKQPGAPNPPLRTIKPSPGHHAPQHAPHKRKNIAPRTPVDGVKHIIAIASGKGGVGKSTTAINLALALQAQGLSVGVLDADVYGPSLPRLAGIHTRPQAVDKKFKPVEQYGLKLMSMGFLVDEETPFVWRGPMVMTAVTQLLRDILWAPLDILVIDMPPGTGDAQLTLAQQVPLSGSVIVSTPQDLALIDARKGMEMFARVDVPVLGIIENMSYFIAPDTGKRYDIFGHGGARLEAEKRNVPFLGEIPLAPQIRAASDDGKPVFLLAPDGEYAARYRDIARRICDKLGLRPIPKT